MNACVHTYTKPQTSSTRNRGPGWRIHGVVEDTKLSTDKQHTLSLHTTVRRKPISAHDEGAAADRIFRICLDQFKFSTRGLGWILYDCFLFGFWVSFWTRSDRTDRWYFGKKQKNQPDIYFKFPTTADSDVVVLRRRWRLPPQV